FLHAAYSCRNREYRARVRMRARVEHQHRWHFHLRRAARQGQGVYRLSGASHRGGNRLHLHRPRAQPNHRPAGLAPGEANRRVLIPLTVFLSAFLLFQVEPLLARYILPWFGGGSSVWTVCLLFYQVLLLVGYAYAHWISGLAQP